MANSEIDQFLSKLGIDPEEPDLLSTGHEVLNQAYKAAIAAGNTQEKAERIAFEAWVRQIAYGEFDMPELPGIPKG